MNEPSADAAGLAQPLGQEPNRDGHQAPSTAAALALFDSLPPVDPASLLGSWRGEGFASDHPLDGVLETYHWHGKRFASEEEVDPLLFRTAAGGLQATRALMPDPRWLARWPWLRSRAAGDAVQRWLLPLLATRRPEARLRRIEHRGVCTAAMLYDRLPILDVFRRLDDDAVLGLMDARGIEQPFFFVLRREPGEPGRLRESRRGSSAATTPESRPGW